LASARMKSRQDGSAAIRASLTSRVFCMVIQWHERTKDGGVTKRRNLSRDDLPFSRELTPRLLQCFGAGLNARDLLGPQFDFHRLDDTLATDDGRDAQADIADAILPGHARADGQNLSAVQRDRVDHLRDAQAHGVTRTPLAANDFRPRTLGTLEDRVLLVY